MSYNSSDRTDATTVGYATLKAELTPTGCGEEFAITADQYSEYEDGFLYYSEAMFYFTGKDGEARDFQNEEELNAHLEASGYTRDY